METVKKFDVFGGCTSRDLFNHDNTCGVVENYFARTSLVSQYTAKIPEIQSVFIKANSEFRRKAVSNDFTKGMFDYFRSDEPKSQFFVMDLLVERLNLLKYRNGYITESNEYQQSECNFSPVEDVSEEEHLHLFEQIVPLFADDLKIYDAVFLNKSLYLPAYVDNQGEIQEFKHLRHIEKMNQFLSPLYELLEKNIKNIVVFDLDGVNAWEGHRWGLSAYHYEDWYYKSVNDKIAQHISNLPPR